MRTSSVGQQRPRNWILASYWSDQKYGTGAKSTASPGPASSRRAAAAPCSTALLQCSTRMVSPNRLLGQRAMSPAATTPGAEVAQVASQTTPLSRVIPDDSCQPVSGTTPMPTTTTSASTTEPSPRRTPVTRPSPSKPATVTPQRRSTPWSWWRAAQAAPISAGKARASGAGSASSMVTSTPRNRAEAATSAPMKPAPTTQTRDAASSSARRARQSASVRSTWTPARPSVPAILRGVAPVAMTRPS